MTSSSTLREPVEFEPNTPVEVALKFAQGKPIETRTGPRVMFSLTDGRVMFLDPEPARLIEGLKARAGEKITVCMQWTGKRGDARQWTAWLATDTELRRAQADARAQGDRWTDRKLEDKMVKREQIAREQSTPPRPSAEAPSGPTPVAKPAMAPQQMLEPASLMLLSQTRQLVDVYWFALSYARKEYGDQVSAEVVLGLVQSAAAGTKHAGR